MKGSSELMAQACAGRRPARTPIFDVFQNDAVIAHFAGRPLDGADDEEVMIRAAANGMDGTRHVLPPWKPGEFFIDEAGNRHDTLRWTHWVTSHAFHSPELWVPWVRTQTEKLEARRSPTAAERTAERERQATLGARLGDTFFIHCTPGSAFNTVMFVYRCGLDALPYLWADEPGLTRRFMRAVMADTIRYIELTAHRSTSTLSMIYSDVAFHGKLMFAPAQMREMGFFDDIAGICDACHRAGLQVIFHSDGYIMEILDDLIASGIDGLNPLEKAAGMDIYDVRRRYSQLILVGGVDVSHLMPFGTPDQVRRETRRIIAETGSEGRLLIGSTTEIGDDIPLPNYLAFHQEVMKG
jgi:hypothetical protein